MTMKEGDGYSEFESLKNVARSVLRNAADADDVVQDAWIAASQNRSTPVLDRGAWLGGVVRNLARSNVRDRIRRREREMRSERPEIAEADPVAEAAQLETIEAVRAAVRRLEERQKSVVTMHCFEGLDTRAIATRLGISQSSVQRDLRLANESLRVSLRSQYGGSMRALGLGLVGAFPWETSDLKDVSFVAKAGGSAAGLVALSKWLAAALVLVLGVVVVARTWNPGGEADPLPEPNVDAELAGLDPGDRGEVDGVIERLTSGDREVISNGTEDDETSGTAPESESQPVVATETSPASGTTQEVLVVDPTGLPVPGADLVSTLASGDVILGTTDSRGRASLDLGVIDDSALFDTNPVNRAVQLFARSPGYVDTHCYLVEKESAERSILTLPFIGLSMRITGRVLQPDGAPAVGALVVRNYANSRQDPRGEPVREDAEGRFYGLRRFQAMTDERGAFELTGVPRSLHNLQVTADGFAAIGHTVEVGDGSVSECTIELQRGGSIAVTVLAVDGTPAVGAVVDIAPVKLSIATPVRGATDDAGRLRIDGAVATTTLLVASFAGARASKEVNVINGEETSVTLQLKETRRIRIRLVDDSGEPLQHHPARAMNAAMTWGTEPLFTDENGITFIEDFPVEPLRFLVFATEGVIPVVQHPIEHPVEGSLVEIIAPREHASLGTASGLLRVGGAVPPPGTRMRARFSGVPLGRTVSVDPASGAFRLTGLPVGKYYLTMISPDQMRFDFGAVELQGTDAELGTLDVPPRGTILFDWRWPAEDAAFYRIRQVCSVPDTPADALFTIAESAGQPVAELDVLPGFYAVIVLDRDGNDLEQNAVEVLPGARQPFVLGPDPVVNAVVSLKLDGPVPESLSVKIYAASIEDDAAFDLLDQAGLANHTTPANFREEVSASQGWSGDFLLHFGMNETHRWILETEWPEGHIQRASLSRHSRDLGPAPVATTFELGESGFEKISEWRD